jgi:hypothetical protein
MTLANRRSEPRHGTVWWSRIVIPTRAVRSLSERLARKTLRKAKETDLQRSRRV